MTAVKTAEKAAMAPSRCRLVLEARKRGVGAGLAFCSLEGVTPFSPSPAGVFEP